MTIDLTPIVAFLSTLGPWGLVASAALVMFGPKLVPVLQKLLAKVPGGVPVVPGPAPTPTPGPTLPDPVKPDSRPVLDLLGKVLLDLLARRAKTEGKAVEAVVAEYVADEVK